MSSDDSKTKPIGNFSLVVDKQNNVPPKKNIVENQQPVKNENNNLQGDGNNKR